MNICYHWHMIADNFDRKYRRLGFGVAVVLLGIGAAGLIHRLGDAAQELERPDLFIALGVCAAVYFAGSSSEESEGSAETLPEA